MEYNLLAFLLYSHTGYRYFHSPGFQEFRNRLILHSRWCLVDCERCSAVFTYANVISSVRVLLPACSCQGTGLMPDSRREGFPLFSYSIPKRFLYCRKFSNSSLNMPVNSFFVISFIPAPLPVILSWVRLRQWKDISVLSWTGDVSNTPVITGTGVLFASIVVARECLNVWAPRFRHLRSIPAFSKIFINNLCEYLGWSKSRVSDSIYKDVFRSHIRPVILQIVQEEKLYLFQTGHSHGCRFYVGFCWWVFYPSWFHQISAIWYHLTSDRIPQR